MNLHKLMLAFGVNVICPLTLMPAFQNSRLAVLLRNSIILNILM